MTNHLRNCAVCQSAERIPLYHPARSPGPVMRCAGCGFVYVADIQRDEAIIDHDSVAGYVEERLLHSADLNDLVGSWEMTELLRKRGEEALLRAGAFDALQYILPLRQPPGRLLDFGCGWGFFLGAAKELGWEIHGLEPLPGHAIYARAQFGAEVVTDVLRSNMFAPESFDVITAFQVFEHLPDPAGNLEILQRALKPGGVILIEVPNINTWSVRLLGKRHRHFVHDHLNFFSTDTLSALLARHGLKAVAHYSPTRRISVRYLTTVWGGRYLPSTARELLIRTLKQTPLWGYPLRLNLGDIVAVVGQKPG